MENAINIAVTRDSYVHTEAIPVAISSVPRR